MSALRDSSVVEQQTHNLQAIGSNPVPASSYCPLIPPAALSPGFGRAAFFAVSFFCPGRG